ncbi:hypothetical protein [Deinococcus sp.]|uniref:hypothetical protein n=1 Tax=Deinococcus sp. TaxID=47478 RepID=UPI003918EAD0
MRGIGRHAAHPDADAGWGAAREVDQDAQGGQGPVGDRAQSTAAGECAVRVVAQADDQTGGLGGEWGEVDPAGAAVRAHVTGGVMCRVVGGVLPSGNPLHVQGDAPFCGELKQLLRGFGQG